MNHLTTDQIFRYVDGALQANERSELDAHLFICSRCRREIELNKSIGRVARGLPLLKPSARFTENVMSKIAPKTQALWVTKIINNLGNVFAMIMVLGILGYTLFAPSLRTETLQSKPSQLSEAIQTFSHAYDKVKQAVVERSARLVKDAPVSSSEQGTKILLLTILCLAILVSIDKFLIQKRVRPKL